MPPTASLASAMLARMARLSSKYWRPASVRRTLRVVRSSRRAPSWSSSATMARVTAAGEMSSRRAAEAKPPSSPTVTKTCIRWIWSICFLPAKQ